MDKIKKGMRLLLVNWRSIIEFELLYKFISLTIFTPVFWGIFNAIMKITGYAYLTIENILSFLLNPITVVALLALFVCMAVYSMIDIGAVIFLLDQSYQGKRQICCRRHGMRFAMPQEFFTEEIYWSRLWFCF